MLGEKIGEERGKVIGQRVLAPEGGRPRIEVTIQTTGKLLGVEYQETATYVSTPGPGNALFGEGEAVMMTKDGDALSWKGIGSGKPTGRGQASSWRGSVCFRNLPQKFNRLAGVACVFEHECDENGNVETKLYEWK
ncbi:MAG TPA: hypothetical protein VGQ83_27755 [Polyangia bacterium]|jgi:hypothetical protein